jgi:hypothetical protein
MSHVTSTGPAAGGPTVESGVLGVALGITEGCALGSETGCPVSSGA